MSVSDRTFKVDFSQIPRKPTRTEIFSFLTDKLSLKPEKLEMVQFLNLSTSVVVEMKEEGDALLIVEVHDRKHTITCNGRDHAIPITMEDDTKVVTIQEVSAKVTNADIISALEAFGEVKGAKDLLWEEPTPFPGVRNGNRAVKMLINRPIPSYITIKGERGRITYRGQEQTCMYCDQMVHYGVSCTQNRKNNSQKASGVNQRLYSAIVQGNHTTAKEGSTEKVVTTKSVPTQPLGPRFKTSKTPLRK
ncbi:uncharacterized protein LOC118511730 [Anopheles stephensi]|uniref:uncharacterized protein LOC118506158 n=1 Tax=Anopheles stephensi TaxID=30069 RepID=UPI001658B7F7|nr:uncharacterized protein LOC118506158 [Anopheles stephensi]XP_035911069.1 uncharacterized protein LOC118511730 [Anopheles stephensi]